MAVNLPVVKDLEPSLDERALEAVCRWRFHPGTRNGRPVTVEATVEVDFRLM